MDGAKKLTLALLLPPGASSDSTRASNAGAKSATLNVSHQDDGDLEIGSTDKMSSIDLVISDMASRAKALLSREIELVQVGLMCMGLVKMV